MEPQNKSILPERPEPTWEVEEIVSPIKPKQPVGLGRVLAFVAVIFVLAASLYNLAGCYHWLEQVEKKTTPVPAETSKLVTVHGEPLPSVTVTDALPIPRISSMHTDVPSGSKDKSAAKPPANNPQFLKSYDNVLYGFTVTLVSGLHAITSEQNSTTIIEYLTQANQLVLKVVITGTYGQTLADVGRSLALSPEVGNLGYKQINGLDFLSYYVDHREVYAVVHNNFTYYLTDYKGKAINTFVLR